MADRPLSIDIRKPVCLKSNDLVAVTQENGDIAGNFPGFGLFFRDTCFLRSYALRLGSGSPLLLMASDDQGYASRIGLTNEAIEATNGSAISPHALSIGRAMVLSADRPMLTDLIEILHSGSGTVRLPVSLELSTRFESMFQLRGAPPGRRGELRAPCWDGETLRFVYDGADDIVRSLTVRFSDAPTLSPLTSGRTVATFDVTLEPGQSAAIGIAMLVDERPGGSEPVEFAAAVSTAESIERSCVERSAGLLDGFATVTSSSDGLSGAMRRGLSDVALLGVRRGAHAFTAAGIPWFVGLFGRDSLLPTIQCLAFNPDLGRTTTTALAHRQGTRRDERTMEEPGKILHELRVGEMAHLREVQQTPSFAAVDSTLLFLIAVARHVEWTGRIDLLADLRDNVGRALDWTAAVEAQSPDGFIAYRGKAEDGGPINQSWRDSGNGVLRADGSFPEPPLALVEVQGYAFQARVLIARVLRRAGEVGLADRLEAEAEALRERFERQFWMEDEGCYCLGLEQGGRQIASVTSNAAQVLWTGIASPERARRTAERVMRADMFSGWGIRTLSSKHPRFDPLAYQQGSVWSFDNALIVSGFRRYGLDAEAVRVFDATFAAAKHLRLSRLPEFLAGTGRVPGAAPTKTPRADPVQAWSAASPALHAGRLAWPARRGSREAAADRAAGPAERRGQSGTARSAHRRHHDIARFLPDARAGGGADHPTGRRDLGFGRMKSVMILSRKVVACPG